jgi:hypothetical protein
VTGASPSEVEIAWMAQGGVSLQKAESRGSRFLGLDSVELQNYLIKCTHGFSENWEAQIRRAYKQVCVSHLACMRACVPCVCTRWREGVRSLSAGLPCQRAPGALR